MRFLKETPCVESSAVMRISRALEVPGWVGFEWLRMENGIHLGSQVALKNCQTGIHGSRVWYLYKHQEICSDSQ